ncbi:MAG: hypothetical protein ACTSPD_20610 [Promethearchaeota archaeon]
MQLYRFLLKVPKKDINNNNLNPFYANHFSLSLLKQKICNHIIKCRKCHQCTKKQEKIICPLKHLERFSDFFIVDHFFQLKRQDNITKNNEYIYRYFTIYPPLLRLITFLYPFFLLDENKAIFYQTKSPVFSRVNQKWKSLRCLSFSDVININALEINSSLMNFLKSRIGKKNWNLKIYGYNKLPNKPIKWIINNLKQRLMKIDPQTGNTLITLIKKCEEEVFLKKMIVLYNSELMTWKLFIKIPNTIEGLSLIQSLLIFRLSPQESTHIFPIIML